MRLTPLIISYERLLPIICDLLNFKWPKPIKTNQARRDQNKRYSYHKDHSHTIKQCKSLHYLVEKLIKVGHLKYYVHTTGGQKKTAQELAIQDPASPATPRAVINYIHGGFVDDRQF